MASTVQIVPKHRYADVETVINDYSAVINDEAPVVEDTSIKQAYAVTAGYGADNVWIKMTSRAQAETAFGKSNFRKYGQPYMQALHVAE